MHDNQKYMSTMQTWTPSVLITVLPVGLLLWSHGSLSASDFFTIIVLSMGFAGPFLAALSFVDELAIVGANVKEINGILDSPELNRPEGKPSLSDEKVCLNQVSFSYGNQDEKVLKGVNLTINPGTVTALVGPSDSGKSTIAKLIAGFWDVTEGNITLGGKDIKEIPLDQLNQEIAYVSQDNYLFDRTIRDNIRMGKLNATDAEVEAVAKAAGCDGFIRKLDKGYDTI